MVELSSAGRPCFPLPAASFSLLRLPPKDSAQWPPHGHGLQQEVARCMLDEMCSSPDGSARCRLAVLLRSEQHAVMPVGGLLFLRSPVVVIVHPGETATLLVRFRIDIIFL